MMISCVLLPVGIKKKLNTDWSTTTDKILNQKRPASAGHFDNSLSIRSGVVAGPSCERGGSRGNKLGDFRLVRMATH